MFRLVWGPLLCIGCVDSRSVAFHPILRGCESRCGAELRCGSLKSQGSAGGSGLFEPDQPISVAGSQDGLAIRGVQDAEVRKWLTCCIHHEAGNLRSLMWCNQRIRLHWPDGVDLRCRRINRGLRIDRAVSGSSVGLSPKMRSVATPITTSMSAVTHMIRVLARPCSDEIVMASCCKLVLRSPRVRSTLPTILPPATESHFLHLVRVPSGRRALHSGKPFETQGFSRSMGRNFR